MGRDSLFYTRGCSPFQSSEDTQAQIAQRCGDLARRPYGGTRRELSQQLSGIAEMNTCKRVQPVG